LRLGDGIGGVEDEADHARRRHYLVDQLQSLLPGIDVEFLILLGGVA
jgi:hypothetical protein